MKSVRQIEFGDFQTPVPLARRVVRLLLRAGIYPQTVIEPTCGRGAFLCQAARHFPDARRIVGLDVNETYVHEARRRLRRFPVGAEVIVQQADFYGMDWPGWMASAAEPILCIGNLPWVNNSSLGVLGGGNLPAKQNADRLRGIEALTGKSNFDVSEWMLHRLLESLDGRVATLAMLCKTRVARKSLLYAWRKQIQVGKAAIYAVDARRFFGAAVDACLLLCCLEPGEVRQDCTTHTDWTGSPHGGQFGYRDGRLVKDLPAYHRWRHLVGDFPQRWRSGIKHDCAPVMELRSCGASFCNGLGEGVELEDTYVYPLLKGSRLSQGLLQPDRWMLVPQRFVGEDTAVIRERAPKTWRYLTSHASRLDRRASSVYRKRPRFSVFGVGDYAFSPWKVAISGFSRQVAFFKIGPHAGKPTVLDDTSYLLACDSEAEADTLLSTLNHPVARELYSALVFWEGKRPVTQEILQALDLVRLKRELQSRSPEEGSCGAP